MDINLSELISTLNIGNKKNQHSLFVAEDIMKRAVVHLANDKFFEVF